MNFLDVLADEAIKYDPRQPRDDLGRWSDGPTERGKISIGHAIHVAKHEGISEDHHHESIRAGIESGRLNTREKVLQHIDAIHDSRKPGAAKPHYQMTSAEFREHVKENPHLIKKQKDGDFTYTAHDGSTLEVAGPRENAIRGAHRQSVASALQTGKDVPAHVLQTHDSSASLALALPHQYEAAMARGRATAQIAPKADASTKQRIDNIADRYGISGMARETLHDEIPREKHLEKRVEEVGVIATAAAVADGSSKVGLDHVMEAIAVVNHPDGFAGYKKQKQAEADDIANERAKQGLLSRVDPEVSRLNDISRHVDTVRRSEVRQTRESVQAQHQANAAYREAAFGAVSRAAGYRPRKSIEDEDMNDTQVAFGAEIKSLGEENGKARIGGYLVYFGGPTDTDLVGDYFTPNTYFGSRKGDGADTMIHHGLPLKANVPELDWTRDYLLAPLKTSVDNIGIFAETVCDLANAHEAKIHDLVKAGKLKWSSGAASHTVRRRDGAKTGEILRWPIIEGSLTPTPCQGTGTGVMPLKALVLDEVEGDAFKYSDSQPRGDDGRWSGGSGGSDKKPNKLSKDRLDAIAKQYGVSDSSVLHGIIDDAHSKGHINSAADLHNILSNSRMAGHDVADIAKHINEHGSGDGKFKHGLDKEEKKPQSKGGAKLSSAGASFVLENFGHGPNSVIAGVVQEARKKGYFSSPAEVHKVLTELEKDDGSGGSEIDHLHTLINLHGDGPKHNGRFRSSLTKGQKSWNDVPISERADAIKSFLVDAHADTTPEEDETEGDNTKSFDWELEMALVQNELMDSRFITMGLSA